MTAARQQQLRRLLWNRILVLDGAMGTAIQAAGLDAADFGGAGYEGCNEVLVETRPDVIRAIHIAYLEAGADIIETDTFGGTPLVLEEYGLGARARELNRLAAEIAREAIARYDSPEKPRFVAGSMGPTTKAISVTGGVTFDELRETYREQALGLIEGGVDYLLVETVQDARNAKAALLGIAEAAERLGAEPAVAVSGTIESMGTTLAGQTVEAMATSFLPAGLLYLGLNCATGPAEMADHLRALAAIATVPVVCVPNAGLPNEDGEYDEDAERMAGVIEGYIAAGWLNGVGGCCGSAPEHVRALAKVAASGTPRPRPTEAERFCLSGLENLEFTGDNRPLLVGERCNPFGSRKFRKLIREGRFDEAAEMARRQVRGGAQVIDICLADPEGDEIADMEAFLAEVVKRVKVPLMIDSTDPAVFARALTWSQGRAALNSVNLEEGEAKLAEVADLARRFGAALVVGCIDEDPVVGMARTRERKLAVAKRACGLLVEKHGMQLTDIIIDPLVFPCASGDEEYLGTARETIEGLRLIKDELPGVRTMLGVSNVSFGLPPAAREIVNSVFLYHATRAGLDLAIVNPQRLERYASLDDEARGLAESVLFESDTAAITAISERYAGKRKKATATARKQEPASQVRECVVEGNKEFLLESLDALLKETPAIDIVNGPLMEAMGEVGRLFDANELIVAEVLLSAGVMKAAVAHLEAHLEEGDTTGRGTIVLATVKGDVHDIGKNLVEIILGNNGYRVVDLGIRVGAGDIVRAVAEHGADLIGLSGLLVKSTAQMVAVAEELSRAGVTPPLLVGGAALSRKFTARRLAPAYDGVVAYARDAMRGLDLANRLRDDGRREAWCREWDEYRHALTDGTSPKIDSGTTDASARSGVEPAADTPQPADFNRHAETLDLDEVWRHLDTAMLYKRHLGLRGKLDELLAGGDDRARKLVDLIGRLQQRGRDGDIHCRAVWQVFEAEARGDSVLLFEPDGDTPIGNFDFPRQVAKKRLCLADYVRVREGRGSLALLVVTAGEGIREMTGSFKDEGHLLESHAVQALALETAEAGAALVHEQLRREWGFGDEIDLKGRRRYRGERYSFGYSTCPDLAGQRRLFELLHPVDIGIRLTEGDMMDPEASVSALVFTHPDCEYFTI